MTRLRAQPVRVVLRFIASVMMVSGLLLITDAVVTLASRDVRAGLTERTPPGFVARWQQLAALGIPVLAIRDNPRFDRSMPDCVQAAGVRSDLAAESATGTCGVSRAEVYAPVPPWVHLPDVPPNVRFLDLANRVCGPDLCPAVIGNVLVLRAPRA